MVGCFTCCFIIFQFIAKDGLGYSPTKLLSDPLDQMIFITASVNQHFGPVDNEQCFRRYMKDLPLLARRSLSIVYSTRYSYMDACIHV